jgi:cytochrome c5
MKRRNPFLVALMLWGLAAPLLAPAAEGDWKRGNVYYRMVCSECHAAKAGGMIGPNTRTKAEWAAYLQADKHAKGADTVKQYFSKAYRDSIKASNKAAAKYADLSDEQLQADVTAFMLRSAKDGDAPTGCR